MIVLTFTGIVPPFYNSVVNIIYNPVNRVITAETNTGGIPRTSYQIFNPDNDAGDLIAELTEGDELVKIFFKKRIPICLPRSKRNYT